MLVTVYEISLYLTLRGILTEPEYSSEYSLSELPLKVTSTVLSVSDRML